MAGYSSKAREGHPNDLKSDFCFVTVKTWKILQGMVQDHFVVLSLEQAMRLFDTTKCLVGSRVLARFASVSLANGYISGKHQQELDKEIKAFSEFDPMVAIKPRKGYR